jgi:hypothetical protein
MPASTTVPEVVPLAAIVVLPAQPIKRKPVSVAEQPGTSPFCPRKPTRTTRQPRRKEDVVDVSTMGNKATG